MWGCNVRCSDLSNALKVRFSFLSRAIKSKLPCGCITFPASRLPACFCGASPLLQQWLGEFAEANCSTSGAVKAKPSTEPFPSSSSSLPSNAHLIFRMVQLKAREKERGNEREGDKEKKYCRKKCVIPLYLLTKSEPHFNECVFMSGPVCQSLQTAPRCFKARQQVLTEHQGLSLSLECLVVADSA